MHGKRVPQRGVGRVEGGLSVSGADEIGYQAFFHRALYLAQHGLSFLRAAGQKREPGKGDEGVAAPGAEPVISCGNHGFAAGGDEKTVVLAAQVFKKGLLEHGFRRGGGMALPQRFRGLVKGLGSRAHPYGTVDGKARDEFSRHEQVFLEIVASFPFHGIEHLVVPVGSDGEGGALKRGVGNLHDKGGHGVVGPEGESRIAAVFYAEGVHEGSARRIGSMQVIDVAAVYEGAQGEAQSSEFTGCGSVGKGVADENSVGSAVEHERAQKHDLVVAIAAELKLERDAVVIAGDPR